MEVEKEIWRNIEGFPGYQVSSLGRVKSMERKEKCRNVYRTRKEKILKPEKNKKGYLRVVLCNDGKMKHMSVHRLVCNAFLDNPLNLPQINHINEIKEDNRVENLEYCDAKYNINFGTAIERRSKAKSKPVKCLENGIVYQSTQEIERRLGFNHSNISACCNKRYGYKTVKGFHWEWA